ncbi:NmrA/HSCARG family protein [Arthrobacter sp. NPDC056886]|uniref:NmrA/HSCARG family protein n=1 Tax=Arthrobacter sp. NPDC056886 TaxID=3345960 RepID=UPI00367007A4
MNTTDEIAVVGATGQQGSATVDALLDRQKSVRALTRTVDSGPARALAERGVAVVAADLDAPESLRSALEGAGAGFAMTSITGPRGTESEISHGQAIREAARGAQLPFLVYSSVGGADRNTGIPHFESKRRIEEILMDSVPVNFLRPTFFMENLLGMIARDGDQLLVRMPMPGDVPLQMISVRDIGKAAATLLAQRNPDTAPVEIAGDEVTGDQIAELVSHRIGAPATFVQVPLDVFGPNEDVKRMFRWFATPPSYRADFGRTRELVPDAEDLQRWLARQSDLG